MLAGIAEGAACRSWPVRSILLWLLLRAETRARDFAGRAGALPFSAEYAVHPLSGACEAVRLADTFRALASRFFALACQAPQCLRMARRLRRLRDGAGKMLRPGRLPVTGQRTYADTS
jgi:hypothetical protein